MSSNPVEKKKVLIFGAGLAGEIAFENLQHNYQIIGFVDNAKDKHGLIFNGLPIYSVTTITQLNFDLILIASEFSENIKQQLISENLVCHQKIQVVPRADTKRTQFGYEVKLQKPSVDILLSICDFLEQQHVRYFVDAGTLLGIYRDGALIPWDDDLDIAILATSTEFVSTNIPSCLERLKQLTSKTWQCEKFHSDRDFGAVRKGDVRNLKLFCIDNTSDYPMVDIFVKYVEGDKMDYTLASRGMSVSSEHILSVDEILFAGQKIKVPSRTEKYLESYYGDWQTPIKEWDLSMLSNTTVFTD